MYKYPKRPLSYTLLKEFQKSPVHYFHYCNTSREERFKRKKPSLIKGLLFELLLLEPERFDEKFLLESIPEPEKTKQAKKNQEYLKSLKIQSVKELKPIISRELLDQVQEGVNIVSKDRELARILAGGKLNEKKMFTDGATGLTLVAKPDLLKSSVIYDLKTTGKSASPEAFTRDIFKFGYHIQAAVYLRAYGLSNYYILAFEVSEPYCYAFYQLSDEVIEYGQYELDRLLRSFQEWYEAGEKVMNYNDMSEAGEYLVKLPGWLKTFAVS